MLQSVDDAVLQLFALVSEALARATWALLNADTDLGRAVVAADRDIGRLLTEAGEAELTETRNAQVATFTFSLLVLDAVERVGLAPAACAGHSLGEYSALAAAGALPFGDGVRLVVERGEAMHQAAEERQGTMAAVLGAGDDVVEIACQRAEADVWVANYNAPGQVVIAGDPDAVRWAGELARELGARKVMPFPVAGAFHTALMAPARARLRKALANTAFGACEVPVVANVDARAHEDAADWPGLLSAQLCSPVRWRQSLGAVVDLGATVVVEVGPGGVLTGLARRVAPQLRALAVATPDQLDTLVDQVAGLDVAHHAPLHQGEHLYAAERVVVSPAAGVFQPDGSCPAPGPGGLPAGDGVQVAVGDQLGAVGAAAVRTPFAGTVVGFLAHPGERVMAGQPLAWLRVSDSPA